MALSKITDNSLNITDLTIADDLTLSSDSAVIKFGADSEITLTHRHNDGLVLKHTGTGSGSRPALAFHAGETDIAANDVLGKIEFQAPDEATGTDAILIAAEMRAISEGDFSASSNATSLEFRTGASESATTKMTLTSAGELSVSNQPSIAMDGTATGAISFSGSDRLITEFTSFHATGITYNSSNGRFTVPTAGKYLIIVNIYLYQNDAFQRLNILDNDSVFVHSSADYNDSDGELGQDNTLSCTIIRDLSANDYITFTLSDGGGRYFMYGAHSHCAIHKLS